MQGPCVLVLVYLKANSLANDATWHHNWYKIANFYRGNHYYLVEEMVNQACIFWLEAAIMFLTFAELLSQACNLRLAKALQAMRSARD